MKRTYKQFQMFLIAMVAVMLSGTFSTAVAQSEEITDEELQTYAMVMDSIDAMKSTIQTKYNDLIQAEELMQGGKRFVEIQGAGEDSVKLQTLNVTEEERMAYDNLQAK